MSLQDVKEAYTTLEWNAREKYYIAECAKIIVPSDPTPKLIMNITSEIDTLLSEALMDLAFVKRKFLDYKTKMNLAEKEYFVAIKQQSTVKLTENEVKGSVTSYLRSHPIYNMKHDIYTLVQSVEYRLTFMESVVKILTEKKASLISDSAMMKIETALTNNTP